MNHSRRFGSHSIPEVLEPSQNRPQRIQIDRIARPALIDGAVANRVLGTRCIARFPKCIRRMVVGRVRGIGRTGFLRPRRGFRLARRFRTIKVLASDIPDVVGSIFRENPLDRLEGQTVLMNEFLYAREKGDILWPVMTSVACALERHHLVELIFPIPQSVLRRIQLLRDVADLAEKNFAFGHAESAGFSDGSRRDELLQLP